MSFRTTVLLFSFVVLSLSQSVNLFTGSGVIAQNKPYTATFGPFNVHETASLSITYSVPVTVCIVSSYGLPNQTHYNRDNCYTFLNLTAAGASTSHTESLFLRDIKYEIGIYADLQKDANTTVEIALTGDQCEEGSFFDGTQCVTSSGVIPGWDSEFSAEFEKGETKFWTFQNPNYVGTFKLSIVSSGENAVTAETVEMYARYQGTATSAIYDAKDTNGNLTFTSPRPGTWVFSVHHAGDKATAHFRLSGQVCGPNSGGVGCMIPVANMTNNGTLVLQGTPVYYRLDAVPQYPLLVSITAENATDIPFLYASRGVIPSPTNFDVPNCNRDYCDIVRSISFNVTQEEEWFFGVFPAVAGNTTYAIWFNSTCIAGCTTDNHGTCEDSGLCHCEIDRQGLDCSISNGLGPQYIVLIIIASLVVASAVIGFVAWAYMRRKRANYEIVS